MLLLDLITEQTVTQPPKIPAAGGVPVPPQVDTAGDAAKAVIAAPKPGPKPQPTGQPAVQAQQAQQNTANPAQTQQPAATAAQESQAELEERVKQRLQQLAGMLAR